MRVLLVRPPDRNSLEAELPSAIQQENVTYPPLGLLYVASAINAGGEDEAYIYDGQIAEDGFRGLKRAIEELKPRMLGITTFSHSLRDVKRCIEISSGSPYVEKIVLGGPHARDFPLNALTLPGVDVVIAGDGEWKSLYILDSLRSGGDLPSIKGVYVKGRDGAGRGMEIHESRKIDLDDYPFPDRTLIRYRKYVDIFTGRVFTTLAGVRGCPYRCTFCNTPKIGYRTRSVGNIMKEVMECLDLGIEEIYFVDDTFNVRPSRVVEFCDEIARRGIEFSWVARARVRGITGEILKKMKGTGCHRIQFGVESGNEIVLKRLRKEVNLREVEEAFRVARGLGIDTVAYFMIGCPGEGGWDGVVETIEYSIRLRPDFAMYNILVPFPGTPLFEEGMREGILDEEGWNRYFEEPDLPFVPGFWEEDLSSEQLVELLNMAYRKFYMRPGMVLRNLSEVRRLRELFRKVRVGVKLLIKG